MAGKNILRRIQVEVMHENAKLGTLSESGNFTSGDLGCSDSSGCSTYCSES